MSLYQVCNIFLYRPIESFVDTSSDSEPEEQKPSSGIGTPLREATAYYYRLGTTTTLIDRSQLGSSKHLLPDPAYRKDSFRCENENEPNNVVQEVAYANLTHSTLRKTGAGICTRSNYKLNASGVYASKHLKRILNHRTGQGDIRIAIYIY